LQVAAGIRTQQLTQTKGLPRWNCTLQVAAEIRTQQVTQTKGLPRWNCTLQVAAEIQTQQVTHRMSALELHIAGRGWDTNPAGDSNKGPA